MNFNGSVNALLKAVNRPPLVFMPNWDKGDVGEALIAALSTGFTAVDTAAHSSHCHEENVGSAVAYALRRRIIKRRKHIFVRTGPFQISVGLWAEIF